MQGCERNLAGKIVKINFWTKIAPLGSTSANSTLHTCAPAIVAGQLPYNNFI